MKTFGTQGPVNPKENYVVSRTEEIADFVDRVKKGKYIVLFAPRQTGKTTLFRAAMDDLASEDYFPIQLNFEAYVDLTPTTFYGSLFKDIREKIERVIESRGSTLPETLNQFLDNTDVTDHFSMRTFFQQLVRLLPAHETCKKLSSSLMSLMPFHQTLFVGSFIHSATFTSIIQGFDAL